MTFEKVKDLPDFTARVNELRTEGWLDWQATPMPFWVCSAAALFVTAMAFSSILHRAIRPPKPQARPSAS